MTMMTGVGQGTRLRWRARARALLLALGALAAPLGPGGRAAAQVPDSAKKAAEDTVNQRIAQRARREVLREAHHVRWYEVVGAATAVVGAMALDEPIQRFAQNHRSKTTDDISNVFRQEGEPLFYAGVSLGTLAAGTIAGNHDIQRAGGRMVAAVALSGIFMGGTKVLLGRSRPNEGVGAFRFHPFSSLTDSAGFSTRGSMPSGHTTAAFAIATSLADDIHHPIVDALLYTFAAGTAYSRINDNRHWFSDTVAGALLGVTAGKLVSGRWRIFNLKPPSILVTPTGTPEVSFHVDF
ncbi:MAG TPA: phosphatase PAP2 family protein [Gemmatimonadales bacterium]|nr:phosphatase PAP2 family protein [Gemmatimonadales bacterium]